MSFKLIKNPEFTHDVEISVPVDGGFSKEKLTTRYRVLPMTELKELQTTDETFLDRIVVGFEGLVDGAGNDILCTREVRLALLDITYIRIAVMEQYQAALAGAARKN